MKMIYVLKTKIFNWEDDYDFRCPILLSNDDIIKPVILRISWIHVDTNNYDTNLRERFWIIPLRKILGI